MRKRTLTLFTIAALLAAASSFAQGDPTGKISGFVTTSGEAVPGVTITVESDALQRERQVFSKANGSYLVPALPSGKYTVTFELEGLDAVTRVVDVSIAQVQVLDVDLSVTLTETLLVTGQSAAISETPEVANTVDQELLEKLAVQRNINSAVALAPGTSATGPGGNTTISGAQSFDNLYMINGVPVNENLRGQASDLFIEDAIEETTVATGGVSAEYGRFTGGVVNTVTKRGGNTFSGSIRDSLTNEKWVSQTPAGEAREDTVNDTFELTLGGYFLKDRLWFFGAGRSLERTGTGQTVFTNLPYPTSTEEDRIQGSLTWSLTPSHQLLVSALDLEDNRTGSIQRNPMDLGAISNDVGFPEDSFAANYTGILSDNFFVEGQYSERSLAFFGIGGTDPNLRSGTPFVDALSGANYYQPTFCGNCDNPDTRETEHAIAKGSYFASTESKGSHDLVFGVDTFNDIRSGDNHQSPTEFQAWSVGTVIRGGEVFPVMAPGALIVHFPILESSKGTSFRSNSAYVNDRWQLGEKWSFNLGLRYDENDGVDSAGNAISDDNNISPRLGASYDLKGDGDLVLNASVGRYVTRLAGTVANRGSAAGTPAVFVWLYSGPAINGDPNAASLVNSDDALDLIFDWFDSVGGTSNTSFLIQRNVPGATSRIDGSLKSPNAEEFTLGISKRLGQKGLVRADYVHRDFGDFYLSRTDTTTGTVLDGNGNPQDLTLIQNNETLLERTYDGLQTSFQYRLSDLFTVGGNWTWSHARGNFNGETRGSGPVTGTVGQYPEYRAFEAHNPRGDLGIDQRHKARAWLLWDAFTSEHHQLDVSLLQSFFSGSPYSAVGGVNSSAFVTNPGYITPPGANGVNYFYSPRGAFRTDDITRTDLSLNYSFLWSGWGKSFEIFLQPEVLNVFDEDNLVALDTTVLDATTSGAFQPFDPFTETPIQGVHWDFGPNFGQARNDQDYQQPRTFRLSLGFRF